MEVVAVNPADLAVVVDIVPGDAINLPGAQNHGHGVLVELLDAAAVGRGAEIDAVGGDIAVAGRAVGVVGISARILRRGGIAAGKVVLHFLVGQLAQLAVEHIAGHVVIGGQVPDVAAAVVLLTVHIDHGILLEVARLGVDVGIGAQRHAVIQGDIVAGALRGLLLLLVVLVDEGLRLGGADVAHIGVSHPAGGRGTAQHRLGAVPDHAAHLLLAVDVQQRVHRQRLRHGPIGGGAGAHGRLTGGHGITNVAGILYRLVVEGNRGGHHGAVFVDLHLLVGVALGALVVAYLGHDRVVRRHHLYARLERALLGGDGLGEIGTVVVVDGQRAGDVLVIAGKADAVGGGHQVVGYGDGLGLRAAADDIAGRHIFGLDGIRSRSKLLDDRRAGQVVADAVAVVDLNGRGGGGLGVGEGHLVRRGLAILADLDGLAAGGLEGVAVHHLAVFHHIVGAHGQVYRHGARHYTAALGHVFKGDGGGHGGLLRVGKHHGDGRAAAVHGEGFRVGAGVEVALRRGRGIAFGAVAFSRRRDLHSAVRHQGLAVRVHMVERYIRSDEVFGIGHRHLNRRSLAVHGEGFGIGAGVGITRHRHLIAGSAVGVGRKLLLGIGGNGRAVCVHMVERYDGVDHLRRVFGIVQHHLNGRAAAVHGEGLRVCSRVGVALHRRLIAGGTVGVGRKRLLGVAGDGRTVAQMVEGHHRVKLLHDLRIVQHHLNGRAGAVHGEGLGARARVGVALHRRLIISRVIGVGGQRLLGVAGNGRAVAHMVEGDHRVELLHDLRIVQRHLNGRAAAVHGEGFGARAHVGVALDRRLIISRVIGVGGQLLLRVAGNGRAVAQMVEGDDGIHRLRLLHRVGKDDRFRLHGAVVVHDDLLHVDLQGLIPLRRVDGKFVDGVAAGIAFKRLRLRHGLLRLVHIDGADGALHRLLLLCEGEHNLRRGEGPVRIRGHLHAGLAHKRVALRLVQVHLDGHAAALCALGGGGVERLAGGLIHVFDGHLHVQVLLHLLLGEQTEAVVPHIAVRSVVVDPVPAVAVVLKALDALGRGHDDILVHTLNHLVAVVLGGRAGAQVQAALGGDAVLVGVLLQHDGLGGGILIVIQRYVNRRARPVHRKALLSGRGVGIALDLRLVVRGGVGVGRKLLLRAGQLLIGGGILVMERHHRVDRLRRILRVVQRHLDRRAGPVHVKAHGVRALEGITVDGDGICRRIIRSHREALRGVVGKGNARVGGVPVMDCDRRVHRFRRILRIVQRHLDGRTGPVRREALRIRRRVGIPLHLHLVDRRIGLHARGRFFRGVAGDLLICVLVQMMDRHNRVHRFRRARRIVQRHLDGRAHAVRRKALRVGIGVGVALHLRLVDGGIGLHVCLCLRSGVTDDLLAGLRVHMMGRHRRVHHLRRAGRVVQRHLDGRAHAVHGKGVGAGV